MFLLKKSDFDFVARSDVKGAQQAIDEGYELVGECDEKTYKITKDLHVLPKETKKKG